MKKTKLVKTLVAGILTVMIMSLPAASQQDESPYSGIYDIEVLPMLQFLPRVYGGMNITAADGRVLYDLIVENGYKRGLEIGTSNGYSGLWMGLAFKKTGGELITLEIERMRAEEAKRNFKKAGLEKVIDARICDAFKEIPEIEGEFDFVFIDAWKADYFRFLKLVRLRMKPGGVITAHNVLNAGRDMQDFLDAIKNDEGLKTIIVRSSTGGISISMVLK